MKLLKSIEHITLSNTNHCKIEKLEEVASHYRSFMQEIIDWHWENNVLPDKYIDNKKFSSLLSERYKQTAGLQAIRTIKSYWCKIEELVKNKIHMLVEQKKITEQDKISYFTVNKWHMWFREDEITFESGSPKKTVVISQQIIHDVRLMALEAKQQIKKPVIENLTLELDAKVAVLEEAKNSFDYWIKLSTLKKRELVYLPITLHKNAVKLLQQSEFKKIIKLKKREDGRWYVSLSIEKEVESPEANQEKEVGVDVGVKALLVDSEGNFYGHECYDSLKHHVEKIKCYHTRRQKLTCCMQKKHSEDFVLSDKRYRKKQQSLTAHRKNKIGQAINQFVDKHQKNTVIAENLSFSGPSNKSRKVNRILNRSLIGYLKNKLQFRLQDQQVAFKTIQPAYSSQECLSCGWISRNNRPRQEKFKCEICDFEIHADLGASLIIKRRSRDKKLNRLKIPQHVWELLKKRFYDAHSVSSWLDLDSFLRLSGKEFREVLNRQSATLKSNCAVLCSF